MSITVLHRSCANFSRNSGIILFCLLALLPFDSRTQEPVETTYPDGTIRERYFTKITDSGTVVKEGMYRSFYKTGNRKIEISYMNGKKDGSISSWYKNGRIRSIISYKNGRLNGPAKWYHANGEPAIIGYYDDNGQREYLWQLYHNTGEKCAQISYRNGTVEKKEYFAPDSVIDSLFRAIENSGAKKQE
ncbi:MAG: hypothetical protein JXA71_15875 [Chitinispirillaceae bacterium]|nr:hypothetical protein [Chitinispirillaceae bacterium]